MHPVLFEIFGFPISPYGVLIACGLIVGVSLARVRARSVGIPDEAVLDVVFWGVVSGFLGARVGYIVVNFGDFLRDPRALVFSRQGFVFLGGLLTALPVMAILLRRWRVRFSAMADLMAPPLALAHAFGRAGCFFAGCCYGKITTLPWGVRFPAGSEAFVKHASEGLCSWTDPHSLPVHPTQLYDVAIQLAIFALLMALWRSRRFHGQVFLIYLWIYPATRIALETVRGDIERGLWFFNLSTSQILSGLILLCALALTIWRRRFFAPVDAPVRVMSGEASRGSAPV